MAAENDVALEVRWLTKRYGSVLALNNVELSILRGEIHALVGENGAGKSTLVALLTGFLSADSGSIELHSKDESNYPVAVVHQHFKLVDAFTVEENFQLAKSHREKGSTIPSIDQEIQLAKELNWSFDPSAKVTQLSVGQLQRIEIIKALAENPEILVLDEPTAVLSPSEIEDLMARLRELRDRGVTIVLIAHKISEILGVADRLTVLRNGKVVATACARDVSPDQVVEWMVGSKPVPTKPAVPGEQAVRLNLESIRAKGDRGNLAVDGVTLQVCAGEIVGIGGVDGNGQVELAEVAAGIRAFEGIRQISESSREFGSILAYLPQDRHRHGVALSMSLLENLMVRSSRDQFWLSVRKLRNDSISRIERYDIRADSIDSPASSLSGGNQQKLIIARLLDDNPAVIVAVNPTRGLDVRAAQEVRNRLLQSAARGSAILLLSTDSEELAELAHRTCFLSRGKIADSMEAALAGASL